GNVGAHSSVTIGTDRLPLISYYDVTNGDLKVAHCADANCASATVTLLDGGAINVGAPSSMVMGPDGKGFISYHDATKGHLKGMHCADLACASATLTTIESQDNIGQFTSVTIGTDGLPLIVYYDATKGDLNIMHCADLACAAGTHTRLDDTGQVG